MGSTLTAILKPLVYLVFIFYMLISAGSIVDAKFYREKNEMLQTTVKSLKLDSIILESKLEEKSIYMQGFEDEFVAVLPLKGKIHVTSHFRTKRRPNHEGIDIVSFENDTVFAIKEGYAENRRQVNAFGKMTGYGRYVKVTNDLYTVEYGHLKKFLLKKNRDVKAGEPIGIMGSSGTSTGTHLHLTIKKKIIDPNKLLWSYQTE